MTVIETALALICTTIGASFTSIPYSMTVAGFKTGVLVNLIVIMTVLFSAYLYWMARMMTQLTHLSEMLYVTLGRSSIFLLNGILAFIIYGLIVIYLTLGARICRSILTDLDIKTEILHQKWPWVLIISAVLFPLFMRRSLSALTFQTKIMCCGVLVLVFVMSEKALNSEGHPAQLVTEVDERPYVEKLLDCSNMSMMGFGFIFNIYPIINSMKKSLQTGKNVAYAVTTSVTFCFSVYVTLTLLAVHIFGDTIK